jgi:hypothetical protein
MAAFIVFLSALSLGIRKAGPGVIEVIRLTGPVSFDKTAIECQ